MNKANIELDKLAKILTKSGVRPEEGNDWYQSVLKIRNALDTLNAYMQIGTVEEFQRLMSHPEERLSEICKKEQKEIVSDIPESAELMDEVEDIYNPETPEHFWFGLKIGQKDCKIGLSDILQCLKFAEMQGEVPKLQPAWWRELETQYPVLK